MAAICLGLNVLTLVHVFSIGTSLVPMFSAAFVRLYMMFDMVIECGCAISSVIHNQVKANEGVNGNLINNDKVSILKSALFPLWTLSITWFDFNSIMDKKLHPL